VVRRRTTSEVALGVPILIPCLTLIGQFWAYPCEGAGGPSRPRPCNRSAPVIRRSGWRVTFCHPSLRLGSVSSLAFTITTGSQRPVLTKYPTVTPYPSMPLTCWLQPRVLVAQAPPFLSASRLRRGCNDSHAHTLCGFYRTRLLS